jgi:hypothetical protein
VDAASPQPAAAKQPSPQPAELLTAKAPPQMAGVRHRHTAASDSNKQD